MKIISNFIKKILGRNTIRKYYCHYCNHSWETDEEYPSCPVCNTKNVRLVK